MQRLTKIISVTLTLLLATTLALAQSSPQFATTLKSIPPARDILAEHAMVVAQERIAARIGVEILDRGGNAVDAAVAVGFALAVTYPRAGNIGGGGSVLQRRRSPGHGQS